MRGLKDDCCNTNVVSQEFFLNNREIFRSVKKRVEVFHSEKKTTEIAPEFFLAATIRIGSHVYISNWVVARSRYDVLLEISLHVVHNPDTNYTSWTVKIGSDDLPV